MGDMAFMDILLFAAVAAFLILRLRSILGRRTGAEDGERWRSRPPERTIERAEQVPDNVTPFPGAAKTVDVAPAEAAAPVGDPVVRKGIEQIRRADPSFSGDGFVQGARGAFEMIVQAFAQGDAAALRPLLADGVNQSFVAAIRDRQSRGHVLSTTLIGIGSSDIVDARLEGADAFVTIRFVSEQVNATRDAAGNVVEGDPNRVETVTDIWTFTRNTRSRAPDWFLVRTDTAQ